MKKYLVICLILLLSTVVIINTLKQEKESSNNSNPQNQNTISSNSTLNLSDTKWKIIAYKDTPISGSINFSNKHIQIKLCNLISGQYTQNINNINVTDLIKTNMGCVGDIMNIENEFLKYKNFNILQTTNETRLNFNNDINNYFVISKE